MKLVFLTALGVGGATILGSIIGFAFKNITHTFSDLVLSFAAGVMLAAAIGLLVVSILKMVYLYRTAKLFREFSVFQEEPV